ncbi:hypothetical protein [Kineosporia mesophila]|uniref:hypothetical protein n=1 Tax=Kineosporia mesophila TaxID=566012 RepID=UPI001E601D63|nr:hypothetical protein [Kineosporia mesophila]MCD5353703.1 hypothetical protein [Kineosporia mesophila]
MQGLLAFQTAVDRALFLLSVDLPVHGIDIQESDHVGVREQITGAGDQRGQHKPQDRMRLFLTCPWVNERSNVPHVDTARPPVKTLPIAP